MRIMKWLLWTLALNPILATTLPTAAQLGLSPGTAYHFAFVTSYGGLPLSTNIADYDNFVQTAADSAGIGSSMGLSWFVIGSTATVNAFTHTNVQGPVFLVNGTRIANDAADLWDGSLLAPLNITELGTTLNALVYTGTTASGASDVGPLGRLDLNMLGQSGSSNSSWIAFGYPGHDPLLSFYAITTVGAVPEPATLWMAGVSLVLIGLRGRRGRG